MAGSVADASVLAALIFNEPRATEAESLLLGTRLHEPALLADELTSVCRRKVVDHPELRPALVASLRIGLALDIEWVEVDHLGVLETSLETGLTTYDATYLWLARALGVPLHTFDRKLLRATS